MDTRSNLVKLTELLLFSLPVCVLGVKHGASVPVALLMLTSLSGIIFFRSKVELSRDEKLLLLLFLVFSLFSFFSWWLHGMEKTGLKNIGEHMRFMLFIPVYLWMRRAQPRSAFLLYGVTIGAVLSLVIAAYDIIILDIPRARGSNHPIMFADMALALGFMAFVAKDALQGKTLIWRLLPVIALLAGITASIMSASRGAWIALPALFLILVILQWRLINLRYKVAILLFSLVLPVLIYIVPATGVERRINDAWNDVDNYITGQTIDTSLGIRFESWKAAYYMVVEHPLLGVGLGHFQQETQALVKKGVVLKGADDFNHTHNDYFYHLSVNGLTGLFLLVLMFIYPLRLFYKHLFSDDAEIKAFSAAGVCLVVAFMHFSFSETLMIRSAPVSFYGFFVITLISLIYNRRQLVLKN